ncbi:MAG TPA: 50S ribosomal protein L20 [Candidatus Paceibacterota bacterium]|nr:50S ribosomal protein L20 [Candidatus Paceibacterota bacterium]HMP19134.1 50S ribosomal protein L20 [Candidatus Paceibacterota bacterium]HMP85157.1 50S ribosomal protein L20 [Candidatus Paceibacterota bacterium]
MTRVKRGTTANKRRRNVLAQVKGYRFGRKNKERMAYTAIRKAGQNAYRHRKMKKRTFRQLWSTKINAGVRPLGISYSKFIDSLKKNKIEIDRKILSEIAEKNPQIFAKIVEKISSQKTK